MHPRPICTQVSARGAQHPDHVGQGRHEAALARLEAERARGLHAQRSFRWEMAQQGDRVGPIRTESEEEDWLESEASKTLEERWWQSQENSDCADAEVDAEVDRLLSQAEAEGRRDVADDY